MSFRSLNFEIILILNTCSTSLISILNNSLIKVKNMTIFLSDGLDYTTYFILFYYFFQSLTHARSLASVDNYIESIYDSREQLKT